jgi:hypothetical protein
MSSHRIDVRHLAQEARKQEQNAWWWLSFIAMAVTVTLVVAVALW